MEIDFQKIMANKSDESLKEYIANRANYAPEAVEAAIAELQTRGKFFSEEELIGFRQEFQLKREAALKSMEQKRSWGKDWKKNVVTDEDAPEYYSEKAIYMFSVLFSMIFGAVLSAINFAKSDDKKGVMEVLGFGVGYTSLEIWILTQIPSNSGLALVLPEISTVRLNLNIVESVPLFITPSTTSKLLFEALMLGE